METSAPVLDQAAYLLHVGQIEEKERAERQKEHELVKQIQDLARCNGTTLEQLLNTSVGRAAWPEVCMREREQLEHNVKSVLTATRGAHSHAPLASLLLDRIDPSSVYLDRFGENKETIKKAQQLGEQAAAALRFKPQTQRIPRIDQVEKTATQDMAKQDMFEFRSNNATAFRVAPLDRYYEWYRSQRNLMNAWTVCIEQFVYDC
jgi:hypothetical protein